MRLLQARRIQHAHCFCFDYTRALWTMQPAGSRYDVPSGTVSGDDPMHSRKQTWPLLALGTFTLFVAYAFWAWRATVLHQQKQALGAQLALRALYMYQYPHTPTESAIAPLLAIESLRYAPSAEANDILQDVLFTWLPLHTTIPHGQHVLDAIFTPDGRYLVTASRDGIVRLIEVDTSREVARIQYNARLRDIRIGPKSRYLVIYHEGRTHDVSVVRLPSGQEVLHIRHDAQVQYAFSPDGRYLATAGADGVAVLIDVAAAREIVRLVHEGAVCALSFSPDGRFLATASDQGEVVLVDVETGRELAHIRYRNRFGAPISMGSVVFSPDGRYLATAGQGMASLLRIEDRAGVWEVARIRHFELDWVNSPVFSPDGRYLATRGGDGVSVLLDVATGQPLARIRHDEAVTHATFSPDGRYLATASRTGDLVLTYTATGEQLARLRYWSRWDVLELTFGPTGRHLVMGTRDGTIALVRMPEAQEVLRISHEGLINAMAFSPDGRYLASASVDGSVVLMDVLAARELVRIQRSAPVPMVRFSPDERYLATASEDGSAALVEVETGWEAGRVHLGGEVQRLVFDPKGKYLAAVGSDGTVAVVRVQGERARIPRKSPWAFLSPKGRYLVMKSENALILRNVATGQSIRFVLRNAFLNQAAVSPDDRLLAMVVQRGERGPSYVIVFDIATQREVMRRAVPEGRLSQFRFAPQGRTLLLCYAMEDIMFLLLDGFTGQTLARVNNVTGPDAFSPDGSRMAVVQGNGMVTVLESASGRILSRYQVPAIEHVNFLVFGPKGRYLVVGYDIDVDLLDGHTGKVQGRISLGDKIEQVVFSPDGRFLAAAGRDGTVVLTQTSTGREVRRFRLTGHTSDVAFSPDGRYLAAADDHGTVVLVDIVEAQVRFQTEMEKAVWDVSFSPDGRRLAAASSSSGYSTVILVDVPGGRKTLRLLAGAWVNRVHFSPDGRYLATLGREVALFEAATGRKIVEFRLAVERLWFTPNAGYLVMKSQDAFYVFPLNPEELLARVCRRLPRNLTLAEWRRFAGDVPYRRTCENRPALTEAR